MNKYNVFVFFLLFLFLGCGGLVVNANDDIDIGYYLDEAKKCYQNAKVTAKTPRHLREYLALIDVNDYVSHNYFGSHNLIIQFKKLSEKNVFSIELDFNLGNAGGCKNISIYEIE
ncbi:hypothetical protein [Agaribacter flavus]|uniref:Lipoprotein n=1 Tax=Agaribacter flavus TaxID=1902781 RepID=A0ABV7FVZ7_9ALTE